MKKQFEILFYEILAREVLKNYYQDLPSERVPEYIEITKDYSVNALHPWIALSTKLIVKFDQISPKVRHDTWNLEYIHIAYTKYAIMWQSQRGENTIKDGLCFYDIVDEKVKHIKGTTFDDLPFIIKLRLFWEKWILSSWKTKLLYLKSIG